MKMSSDVQLLLHSGLFSTLACLDPLEAEFHIFNMFVHSGRCFSCWGGITVCPVTMWDLLILVGTEDESNLDIKDEDSAQGKVRLALRERVHKWLEVNVL